MFKPGNFLLRADQDDDVSPDLLLGDFGIARLVNASSQHRASGERQHGPGTPASMAPEQWANRATFASDQYALAIMAYELLAGDLPFSGPAMSVMYAHTRKQPPDICEVNPDVPAGVNLVLQRALAKRPEERFPSVSQMEKPGARKPLGVRRTCIAWPGQVRVL